MDDQDRAAQPPSPVHRAARIGRRREEVLAQLADIEQELVALRSTREGLTDDDEHDPDGVPLSAQWDRLEGLMQAKLQALATIDEATVRAESGEDELCRVCGKPIAPARLAVRPEATTCIDCAA